MTAPREYAPLGSVVSALALAENRGAWRERERIIAWLETGGRAARKYAKMLRVVLPSEPDR
jgi:hypothetical protein